MTNASIWFWSLTHFGVSSYLWRKTFEGALKDRYGDAVVLYPSMRSLGVVISYQTLTSRILMNKWYTKQKSNALEERKGILDAAIIIVQEEIRSQIFDCSSYPNSEKNIKWWVNHIGEILAHVLSGLMKTVKGEASDKIVLRIAYDIISSLRSRSFVSAVKVVIGVFFS